MTNFNDYLTPLRSLAKRHRYATVDIESKDGDTQVAGFTRPFLVGVYDGVEYVEFRDEPHLKKTKSWEDRYWAPGGCVDKALVYLLSDRFRGVQFYAHNGGSFDHLFWLAWLKKHSDEFSFEVVPVQSSIQKVEVKRRDDEEDEVRRKTKKRRRARNTWTFLDSMKLFPGSLKKMLATFGLDSKVEHDLHMQEDDDRWSAYLRRDCVGLYEALTMLHDLIENKLGGEVGMTAPATAMKLYRRQFLPSEKGGPEQIPRHAHFNGCRERFRKRKKDEQPECLGCCHEFVRRAYYGGRTEPMRMHGTELRYFDINSSYVSSMRESMPAGERLVEHSPRSIDWRRHKDYVGFAECDVEIPPDCHIPPLPHRAKSGKLIFPAGRFHGVWDVSELQLLDHERVRGKILNIDRIVWFKRVFLFQGMVDVLWALRNPLLPDGSPNPEYDRAISELAKLLGNSGYGKFGMREERTQIVFRKECEPEQCFLCLGAAQDLYGLCKMCEGSKPATSDPECDVWYQARRVDAPYIIPQIAAHITTLARMNLFNFMMKVKDAGGDVYYTDTDSVITDVDMPSSKKLGEFKDEHPGEHGLPNKTLDGIFLQPKVYMIRECEKSHQHRTEARFVQAWGTPPYREEGTLWDVTEPFRQRSKVTMKGFPQRVRTEENLSKLRAGEDLRFDRLEKVRTLARTRFTRGPQMVKDKDGVRGVVKGFRGSYDKRIMHEDGTTSPLVLDEIVEEKEAAE